MRLLINVVIVITGLTPLWAQTDLGRNDLFQAGDVVDYFAVDATNANPGPAGNGVTWDFSNLPRRAADDYTVTYADPSVAPNAADFPESNLVAVQDAGQLTAYTFMSVSNQKVVLEGLDIPELGVVTYTDKSEWIDLPFQFNEMESDDFVGVYSFNFQGITGVANRTGNLTTTYDGFGTIILPNGESVPNVRRLKLEQTTVDVINVMGVSITTTTNTTTYSFYAVGERTQVFQLIINDATVNPPGTTVNGRSAFYREVDGMQPPLMVTRRAPHLTTATGGFDSEVLIHNPGQSAQTLTLTPLSGGGDQLAPVDVMLAGGATSRVLQQQYFSTDARSFSASGCDDCIFSVGYRARIPDGSTAQVHQTNRFEDEFYFYPGEWDLLFDGAAIINAGGESAKIEAYQLDYDGNMMQKVTLSESLAPGAKHLTLFNDLFVNDPDTLIKLESTQPMAVMILRISNDFRFLYQNPPLPREAGPGAARWLAHITSETGGFDTDILIHNASGSAKTVTLHPYNSAGQALAPVEVDLPGDGSARFAKTVLFDGDTSHASITGAAECLVSVGYRSVAPDSSTAAIHEAPPVTESFLIYPGEWSELFDGLALVNTGNASATITAVQIGDNGQELNTVVLAQSLAPNAKFLGLLEGRLPENANSVIRIESTQPLAILSLRLSKDNRFLYANPPLPQ